MTELCTVHQVISGGIPLAQGSAVRLPSGEAIPGVLSVTMRADAVSSTWVTTIELNAKFGEPISADSLQRLLGESGTK